MEISIIELQGVKVVSIDGELDGASAPQAQGKILPLASPEKALVIDMSKVGFMSSAGLRMFLNLYRSISGHGGKVILVGLSEYLVDTMSLTGFLDFFEHYATLDEGLAAISGSGR